MVLTVGGTHCGITRLGPPSVTMFSSLKRSLSAQSILAALGFSLVACLIGCWAFFHLTSRQFEQQALERERAYIQERLASARAPFARIEEAHRATRGLFDTLYEELSDETVQAAFETHFSRRDDGSRRFADSYFDGAVVNGQSVYGLAGIVPPGDVSLERQRILVAAFEAISQIGPANAGTLESLWFLTPHNEMIIFAPHRLDELIFYRHQAPADIDFQVLPSAQLVLPENSPGLEMRCGELTRAAWDPSGASVVTGCQTPQRRDGRHIAAWGVTLPLNDALNTLISNAGAERRPLVMTAEGDLIISQELGFAETADAEEAHRLTEHLGLSTLADVIRADGAPSGAVLDPAGQRIISYARVGEPDWVLVELIELGQLRGEITASALMAIAVITCLLAGQAALLGLFYQRRVFGPVTRLTDVFGPDHATRTGALTPIDDAVFNRTDEVGVLANALRCARLEQRRLILSLEKRVEERTKQYRKASEAKSQFLATMSHEIRTPMNGVLGMLALVLDTEKDPVKKDYLDTAHESARNLLSLLNDILDYSRLEAGEVAVVSEPYDPSEVAEDVVRLLRPSADSKALSIALTVETDAPETISGDDARLRQVLVNLVSNAVKFTHEGEIAVTVRRDSGPTGAAVRIEVRDTGIGIAPETLPNLFQRFSQGDSSMTRRYGGAGLGLAISKQLVELMGGEIGVTSVPGEGSCFWLTLPVGAADVMKEPLEEAGETETRPKLEATGRRFRVLAAEDHPANQKVLSAIFRAIDVDLTLVENGEQALAALDAAGYDLVLMDVQMPGLDGVGATIAIRSRQSEDRNVPIIALTANAMAGDKEAYLAAGMTDYVAKPIEPSALLATIKRVVGPAFGDCDASDRPAA